MKCASLIELFKDIGHVELLYYCNIFVDFIFEYFLNVFKRIPLYP